MKKFNDILFTLINSDEDFKKSYHTSQLFNNAINEIRSKDEEDQLAAALKIIQQYDAMYNLLLANVVACTDKETFDAIFARVQALAKEIESKSALE